MYVIWYGPGHRRIGGERDMVTQLETLSDFHCFGVSGPSHIVHRDLWPFRHLIRVMRRHHLTKPYIPTHPPTYLSTSFRDHPLWVIYETISGRSYFGPKVWNWLNPIEKNHGTCHSSRVINYICHHHNTSYQRPRLSIGRFFPCHFLKVLKQEILYLSKTASFDSTVSYVS